MLFIQFIVIYQAELFKKKKKYSRMEVQEENIRYTLRPCLNMVTTFLHYFLHLSSLKKLKRTISQVGIQFCILLMYQSNPNNLP